MKIKFLGTAAYDAIPTPFCTCESCAAAKKAGGKSIRTRSQALINDDLLIDYNADTVSHFLKYDIDTLKIKNCLITHSHSDHLYPKDTAIAMYSGDNFSPINYYAAKAGYVKLKKYFKTVPAVKSRKIATLNKVEPFKAFNAGGYKVLPLKANHDPAATPVVYAIEKDGKRLLYLHDTGTLPVEDYAYLKEFGVFDFVTMDCTGGLIQDEGYYYGHLTLKLDEKLVELLKKEGIINDNTIIVANHFSHNGGIVTHENLVKAAEGTGIIIAYDGLEIEF